MSAHPPLLATMEHAAAWNTASPTLVVYLLEGEEPPWRLRDPQVVAASPAIGVWSLMFWHADSRRAFYRKED